MGSSHSADSARSDTEGCDQKCDQLTALDLVSEGSSQDTEFSNSVTIKECEYIKALDIVSPGKENTSLDVIKTGMSSPVTIHNLQKTVSGSFKLQSHLHSDVFECYQKTMQRQGLEFELAVNSVLRATEFRPFQKKICFPTRCGRTLKAAPHMRGFWFATLSFFLAFFCCFSMAPLMVVIRKDIGICDNQPDVDAGTAECICKGSCKDTIGNLKIASLCSTVIIRLLLGGLLERFGPRKVQCTLLFCGSMFVAGASLIRGVSDMIIVGTLLGTIAAAFITTQFWMTLLFSPEILGLVNGTAGGWGNLGGGFANMVMPLFYEYTRSWRIAFLIPAGILLLFTIMMFFYSQDTPMGQIVVHRDLKKQTSSTRDYLKCISDYRVCILAIQYGACCGAELIMNWELATHFHDYFGMSVTNAGRLSSGFGAMSLFAMSLGGSLSDKLNMRMGLRGRLLAQFLFLFCEGVCLLIFGFMSRELRWERAFFVMVCLSIFIHGGEGTTFSLVPYILPENIGIVSAITGAGGPFFGAVIQALCYKIIPDYLLSFKLHAIFVFLGAFLTFLISFELQGSLLHRPKLAKYCDESLFTYVLEWELEFDSTYRVIGSYISPTYLRLLSKKGKEEQYVKAAKQSSVQYGEGLLGGIGETRRSCVVHYISNNLAGDAKRGAVADEIKTGLFFPSSNGKKVIEIGGSKAYELAEGVTLVEIESIITGKCNTKDLKACLREVIVTTVN